jgi:hypothetical protein
LSTAGRYNEELNKQDADDIHDDNDIEDIDNIN